MADIILHVGEQFIFTPFVFGPQCSWSPESYSRQWVVIYCATLLGAIILYFITAGLNYWLVFDKTVLKDQRLLPHQVRREILYTLWSAPYMAFLQTWIFMLELRGHSKLYDNVSDYGLPYLIGSLFLFVIFTDCLIYFIHRGLHELPYMYQYVHKPHHAWIVTTPFASHAFHPLDGWLQGLPYHLFVFFFPFHKIAYLVMFVMVNIWTVSIHDASYNVPHFLEGIVNGAGHHTIHHSKFYYNYGQYFTLWDRMLGSHKLPTPEEVATVFKKTKVDPNAESKKHE